MKLLRTEDIIEFYGRQLDIPGMIVAVANGKETKICPYGYADRKRKIEIKEDTLFEIASLSKAFTALVIFLLEQKQMISLNDNITKYLEGLKLCLKSTKEDLTGKIKIRDLLYHTSGLEKEDIYIGLFSKKVKKSDLILKLNRHFLIERPGIKYEYNSINYVLLAMIVECVTKKDFAEILETKIFKDLGFENTYADRKKAVATGKMSCGYKIKFRRNRYCKCTDHRAEIASGYIISNIHDMIRWAMIQEELVDDIPEEYKQAIKRSHIEDSDKEDHMNFYYAGGWHIHMRESRIMHMGNNPAFSAYIEIRPRNNSFIIVLMNMNTLFTMQIGDDIRRNRIKDTLMNSFKGMNDVVDKVNTLICLINALLLAFICVTIVPSFSIFWFLIYTCIGAVLLGQYVYINIIRKIKIKLALEWVAGSLSWSYISYIFVGVIRLYISLHGLQFQ